MRLYPEVIGSPGYLEVSIFTPSWAVGVSEDPILLIGVFLYTPADDENGVGPVVESDAGLLHGCFGKGLLCFGKVLYRGDKWFTDRDFELEVAVGFTSL